MTRDIPKTKRISEVKLVTDLNEGERAVPDSDLLYHVRLVGSRNRVAGAVVEYVTRQGDELFAVTHDTRYNLTQAYELVAKNRRREKSSARSKMVPKPRGF